MMVSAGHSGSGGGSREERPAMPWRLVPSGSTGLPAAAGCDGGAHDRDNMCVLHEQARAEGAVLG